LIAAGKLRPTIAVFIDPREPGNPGNNRRIAEYSMNPKFANFVAGELVPAIDAAYRTDATADGRTILGTSMGGLNAAYFGATNGNVFDNIAIQSPAYNQNSAIYGLYQNNDLKFLDIFQTSGTLGGDGTGATQMAGIWTARGYQFSSLIANEGHSWGQWRGQLDDILIKLIGPPMPVPEPKSASLILSVLSFGVLAAWRVPRHSVISVRQMLKLYWISTHLMIFTPWDPPLNTS
jgi:enterochelin esterase family protein